MAWSKELCSRVACDGSTPHSNMQKNQTCPNWFHAPFFIASHPAMASLKPGHLTLVWLSVIWRVVCVRGQTTQKQPLLPAIIAFGDSTVDTGNNNDLTFTLLRANFYPYGIDYPGGEATGRFSNGFLVPDYIARRLGLPRPPPFFNAHTKSISLKQGVDFASAGSGLIPSTAIQAGVIQLQTQIDAFQGEFHDRLVKEVGEEEADYILKEALYIGSVGSNDYMNNYLDNPILQGSVDPEAFQDHMVEASVAYLEAIHDGGARRMVILSLIPLGCLPSQKTRYLADFLQMGPCVDAGNQFSQGYNAKMKLAVGKMQGKFSDSIVIFADIYDFFKSIVDEPQNYGMKHAGGACCGYGLYESGILCNSDSPLCSNATDYVFWDSFHPSQQSYKAIADYLWDRYSRPLLADLPS